MIRENSKLFLGTLQPVSPFLQCELNGQKLLIADVVVYLRRGELFGKEGAWMETSWIPLLLREHCSYPCGGRIHLNNEWFVGIWMDEERCYCVGIFEALESLVGCLCP